MDLQYWSNIFHISYKVCGCDWKHHRRFKIWHYVRFDDPFNANEFFPFLFVPVWNFASETAERGERFSSICWLYCQLANRMKCSSLEVTKGPHVGEVWWIWTFPCGPSWFGSRSRASFVRMQLFVNNFHIWCGLIFSRTLNCYKSSHAKSAKSSTDFHFTLLSRYCSS